MRAEHCAKGGCNYEFTTGNYHITTTPKAEWKIIVDGEECPGDQKHHGRVMRKLEDCMQYALTKQADLIEAEVVSAIMYTGPMVLSTTLILM